MWPFAKRVVLFVGVNILILLSVSIAFQIITSVLGLNLDLDQSLFLWYGVMGFGSALIGLALSRQLAKWSLGVRVIDPQTRDPRQRRVLDTVHQLARAAGLPKLPEVGIYDSPEVNAFATGPTKARSLVAVSTGLLDHMDADAVAGVLGHEIAHVANGDMVTMTLLQGLINTMVSILARIVSGLIAGQAAERSRPMVRLLTFYALQICFSLLGVLVISYFSRRREYRADAGGARLAGRERMLAGLTSLRQVYGHTDPALASVAALRISGRSMHNLAALFSTHPPLEDRIRRLEAARI